MSQYDAMDASDEGQLKSSGEDFIMSGDDDDNDSLDIKPPQATRDIASGRRKEKSSHKDKKRSREKRHKERHSSGGGGSGRERDRDRTREREHEHLRERKSGGGMDITDRDRRDHHRERRSNPERSHMHGHSRSYERGSGDDGGGSTASLLSNNEHRYQKHYDGSNNYHHQTQQQHHHHHQQQHYVQQQYHSYQAHMQRQRQDYYERGAQSQQNYHQNAGNSGDYHHHSSSTSSSRHQSSYGKHSDHGDYDAMDMQRERRKYAYEKQHQQQSSQKDPESLEQDLRSRLLSKRHKYVKGGDEDEEVYESRAERKEAERASKRSRLEEHVSGSVSAGERSDRERSKSEKHHQQKREKLRENVIEVLDSPEQTHTRRKHKRHSKEVPAAPPNASGAANAVLSNVLEKRKTPDDPELLARRAKFLAAEREKEQRKESAREELEARREKRRERKDVIVDALSPSAVAASVTAGLNVVKRRSSGKTTRDGVQKKRHKKSHRGGDAEEYSDDDDDDSDEDGEREDDDDDDESTTSDTTDQSDDEDMSGSDDSHTDTDRRRTHAITGSTKTKNRKRKSRPEESNVEDDDDDLQVVINDSPLSVGEIEKSPMKRKAKRHKKQRHHGKHASRKAQDDGLHDSHDNDDGIHSDHSRTPPSHSHSHSNSASRSQSRSRSQHTSRRHHSRTHSRSFTHSSRSVTRSPQSRPETRSRQHTRSNTRSRSRSRSSSGTRSEERGMKAFQQRAAADVAAGGEAIDAEQAKAKLYPKNGVEEEEPLCDEKGVLLPNYYPGVQGCRSVEEFQCLNRIEEGTYGVVYRAKDKRTNEIVALKRLKMEKEKEGFPITSLREINTLLKGQHPNIVTVREIVVGSNMDKIFIVMDYVEHDLKSLMETMKNRKQSFFPGEVKCLTQQLLRAVSHLHDNWILHRDLKTSNLLLSHKGILKVGDFGLAREYGSPLKKYTSLVVTLWYRAPELLLCAPEYSTPIDVWSVGCIFAEFLQMTPLFPGKAEIDQLNKIFKELGTPNEKIWPGYQDLPAVKNVLSQNPQFTDYPVSNLRKRFMDKTTELGIALLQGLLTYDPKQRLNARAALRHAYFRELPLPIDPSMFPTWPAKSELGARKALGSSPKPPSGGSQFKQLGRDDLAIGAGVGGAAGNAATIGNKMVSGIITGNKKTAANTGFVLNAGIDQRQLAMGPGFSLKF